MTPGDDAEMKVFVNNKWVPNKNPFHVKERDSVELCIDAGDDHDAPVLSGIDLYS